MERTIHVIKKSTREEIRIALSEFTKDGTTYDMVSARVFYDDGAEYRPGRNGINLEVDLLPALIEGLQAAADEARAANLLADDPECEGDAEAALISRRHQLSGIARRDFLRPERTRDSLEQEVEAVLHGRALEGTT